MSDFNTQDDYCEEEVQQQTRAKGWRRLPLWALVVILLLILAIISLCCYASITIVFITDWNPFELPAQPTVEIISTVTPVLPTLPPFPTATPKSTPIPSVPTEVTVGSYVKVVGAEADQPSYRSGPGLNYARLKLIKDGAILKVLDGPEEADGLTWWRLEDEEGDIGWTADTWLKPTLP